MAKRLKIILFQPYLKSRGGMEKLVLEYVKRSKHKINIITWFYDEKNTFSEFQEFNILEFGSVKPLLKGKLSRAFATMVNILKKLQIDADLFLLSSGGLSELVLLTSKINGNIVIYSHTPLRYASYDCMTYYLKKSKHKRHLLKFLIHIYNSLERKSWKRVKFAIFNSYLSRKRALDKGLISINKTKVIYPGVDLENLYYDEPEDYFLYVSRFGAAKRQDILIKSFVKFSKKYKEYNLILAGGLESRKYLVYLLKLINNYRLQNRIQILYNLSSHEIANLYSKSLAFVHVPFMEDFGIAPLEAAAAGKFIINVYPSGNYEILKKFPGVYWIKEKVYDNYMINNIYAALEYFVKNRDDLIEKGKENRKLVKKLNLSWTSFTKQLDTTLENIM